MLTARYQDQHPELELTAVRHSVSFARSIFSALFHQPHGVPSGLKKDSHCAPSEVPSSRSPTFYPCGWRCAQTLPDWSTAPKM